MSNANIAKVSFAAIVAGVSFPIAIIAKIIVNWGVSLGEMLRAVFPSTIFIAIGAGVVFFFIQTAVQLWNRPTKDKFNKFGGV